MKIAYFADLSKEGGVERSIKFFSEKLDSGNNETYVICSQNGANYYKNMHLIHSFRSKVINFGCQDIGFPSLRDLKKIRDINPDVIHVQTPGTIGLLGIVTAKIIQKPIVMTYHTPLLDYFNSVHEQNKIDDSYFKFINSYIKWFYEKADEIIVASNPVKKSLSVSVNKRIRVIPNGLNLDEFKGVKAKKFKTPTVISNSRLSAEKRVDVIITEFARLLEKTNARLLITSDGPEKNKLIKLVKKLGIQKHVTFTGFIPRKTLLEYYKSSHVFVSASKVEGQGISILEAMALGCPVIAANDLGPTDFIVNEKNGLLFDSDEDLSDRKSVV